ncbi:hypothetical protein TNCV_1040751 [Trichonephila clavipes]|nr:hypothetical protein TNCV_1040751 [Trichonephila clavipes]
MECRPSDIKIYPPMGKNFKVNGVLISLLGKPLMIFHSVQTRHCTRVTDLNSVNRMPVLHGNTINSHRTTSPLVRLVEGEERWEAPDHPQVSFLKIGVETSQIVQSPVRCSKLRLTTGVP